MEEKNSKEEKYEEEQDKKPPAEEENLIISGMSLSDLVNNKDIINLVDESKKLAAATSLSETEIEKLINSSFESFNETRLLTEDFNAKMALLSEPPLSEASVEDYNGLAKEGLIGEETAQFLTDIDKTVKDLKSAKNPPAAVTDRMEQLISIQTTARADLEKIIQAKQEELKTKNEQTKDELFNFYSKKIEAFNELTEEIQKNPRAMDRIKTIAEKEFKNIEKKYKQKREQLIGEASHFVKLLSSMHAKKFNRIAEVAKKSDIKNDLVEAVGAVKKDKKDQQAHNVISAGKSMVVSAIIDGEGDSQVKSIKEIAPWLTPDYFHAFNAMNSSVMKEELSKAAEDGDDRAESILREWDKILVENEALRKLIGKAEIRDHKTGKKIKGTMYQAFETRRENDLKGITEQRKKARENIARQKEEFKKEEDNIINRGGGVAEETVIKFVNGKKVETPKGRVAFRLEIDESKKNNKVWKVVELTGGTNSVKVGRTSPLDFSGLPSWMKKKAEEIYGKEAEKYAKN